MSFEHPDYVDVRPLAKGGQAVVYRARHVPLDRPVAVKVLRDATDTETVERLLQEARLVARLRHPNLVQVYDAGTLDDGRAYVVMECIEGATLERLRGAQPTALAVRLIAQVAGALGAAHDIGVVHRDVKPSNILLDGDDTNPITKLADFGIAHVEDSNITATGMALGTPSYMAPECFQGDTAEPPADIYALGLLLHLLLTGKRPFEARSAAGWMGRHLSEDRPQLPGDLDVPDSLRQLHDRMVALEPADRPANGKEVEYALLRVLGELEPTLSVPLSPPSALRADPPTDTVSVGWLGLGAAALTTGGLLLAAGTLVVGLGVGAAAMRWSDGGEVASVEAPPQPVAVDGAGEEPDVPPEAPEVVPVDEAGVATVEEAEAPTDAADAAASPSDGTGGGDAPSAPARTPSEPPPAPADPPTDVAELDGVVVAPDADPTDPEPANPEPAAEPEPEPEPAVPASPAFPVGTYRGEASGRPVVLVLSGTDASVAGTLEIRIGAKTESHQLQGRAVASGASWALDLSEPGGWTVSGTLSGDGFSGKVGMGGKRAMPMEASK